MIALVIILIFWIALSISFWPTYWEDSDKGVFEIIAFFTPFNIVIFLMLIVHKIYKIPIKIIKYYKKKKSHRLHKDIDPYGEENWEN